jgi:hypothetical protein
VEDDDAIGIVERSNDEIFKYVHKTPSPFYIGKTDI